MKIWIPTKAPMYYFYPYISFSQEKQMWSFHDLRFWKSSFRIFTMYSNKLESVFSGCMFIQLPWVEKAAWSNTQLGGLSFLLSVMNKSDKISPKVFPALILGARQWPRIYTLESQTHIDLNPGFTTSQLL